jgi:hypothetical protein
LEGQVRSEIPNSVTQEIVGEERLFHYTSAKGLYGILESGALWATHFRFLNDAQECRQAERSLERHLHGGIARKIAALVVNKQAILPSGTDTKKAAAIEAAGIVKILYDIVFKAVDPFVFSAFLCGPDEKNKFQDGELQHWATYGRDGYAIQMSPTRLGPIIENEAQAYTHGGIFCSAVEYVEGDVAPPALGRYYDVLETVAAKLVEYTATGRDRTPELDAEIESTFIPFVRTAAFVKSKCFEHEREGRIVFYRHKNIPDGRRNHPLKIALHGSFGVPYIALFGDGLMGPETPIERIIIGPHPEHRRRREALELYLAARNLNIPITESGLPYSPR